LRGEQGGPVDMDNRIRGQVEKLLADASIASVRSWLKSKEKKSTATSRRTLVDLVAKLVEETHLTFTEVEEGIISIEEAGGKRIFLFDIQGNVTLEKVKENISGLGLAMSAKRERAAPKARPSVVYINLVGKILRAKWTEIHKKLKIVVDGDNVRSRFEPVAKIIVLVADLASKNAQIRFDRPEDYPSHRGKTTFDRKAAYFAHYIAESQKILGGTLVRSELQNALKLLMSIDPSPVRIQTDGHTNQRNNNYRISARNGDIRDDDEWQAMYKKGGKTWAHDQHAFYWRPDQSNGFLSREVYSHVDSLSGAIRVEADCSDAEVDYAVRKIRELQ
jgi:hypothetical protein